MKLRSCIRNLLLLTCTTAASCTKLLDREPSGSLLTEARVFASDSSAETAAAGLYQALFLPSLSLTNGGAAVYGGLSADELSLVTANAEWESFARNEISSSASLALSRLWTAAYRNLHHAHSLMEELALSGSVSAEVKRRLRGEALVVRALHYFYLGALFGDVPLVLSTDYPVNRYLPRTRLDQVRLQSIADLLEAKDLLSNNNPATQRFRPDRAAATALLARFYLYLGDWQRAEAEATQLVQDVRFSLPPPAQVFLTGSPEAIWQLLPVSGLINIAESVNFLPVSTSTRPSLAITNTLLAAFEAGDLRRQQWLRRQVVGTQEFYLPFKYRLRTNPAPFAESIMVLRLAEQYLVRAEARTRQGKLAEALQDLNRLRQRAGLSSVSWSTQADLLQAIEQERRVELFAEWGHRWLDLARTGRATAVLEPLKSPYWQIQDLLYPLPLEDLQRNPFLVQNPGY